jgi:hypothetical protein
MPFAQYFTFTSCLTTEQKLKEIFELQLLNYIGYEKLENQIQGFFIIKSTTNQKQLKDFKLKDFNFTSFRGDPFTHFQKVHHTSKCMITLGKWPRRFTIAHALKDKEETIKRTRLTKEEKLYNKLDAECKMEHDKRLSDNKKRREIHDYLMENRGQDIKLEDSEATPRKEELKWLNGNYPVDYDIGYYNFIFNLKK